ncbi:VanZ like family protein [compost metagenome]
MTARRRTVLLLLLYLAALACIGFWPTPVERPVSGLLRSFLRFLQDQPLTAGIRAGHVEVAANVLLFVPLGLLIAGLLPPRRWWLAAAAGLLGSVAIEAIQFLALDQRQASLRDVAGNTLGALLGALAAVWARRRHRPPLTTPVSGTTVPGRNT